MGRPLSRRHGLRLAVGAAAAGAAASAVASSAARSRARGAAGSRTQDRAFAHLATYRGVGMVLSQVVGPGPAPGAERLYQSYHYRGGALDVVAVDPDTGAYQVFTSPVPEEGAWAMAVGPDGNLYLGTNPHAHLLRLDPRTGQFVDLGRPGPTEQWIWQLAAGADGRLYGATSQSARLVRYDPATGRGDDLGRMDDAEEYARTIAASDDGFLYLGVGTAHTRVVAYELATGRHRDILPPAYQTTGFPWTHRGDDGRVYAAVPGQRFRLEGWQAIAIPESEVRPEVRDRLRDGRRAVQAADGVLRLLGPSAGQEVSHPFDYAGKEIDVFRLGLGPDGHLYGSAYLPARVFRVDLGTGPAAAAAAAPTGAGTVASTAGTSAAAAAARPSASGGAAAAGPASFTELGELGTGEFYSFLRYGRYLLGAAYYGKSAFIRYDPARPYAPGVEPDANPRLVDFDGFDPGWRPMAMIAGPGPDAAERGEGEVYLGAIAAYGRLGGPLVVWGTASGAVESFPHVVEDQSVVSLALVDGLIVGGTTVDGGGGAPPTQPEAKLFLWDPRTRQKLFETVPVAGARHLTALVAGGNGRVYGIAGGSTVFGFDVAARTVAGTAPLALEPVVYQTLYNCAALGPDGRIWGVTREHVFAIDPVTLAVAPVARLPEPCTAGFALDGAALYYASGPKVCRFRLPFR